MIPARLRPDPLGRSSKRSKRLTTTGCKWVSANARRYEADEEGREGEVRPEPLGVSEERAEDGAEARPDDPVDPEGRAHPGEVGEGQGRAARRSAKAQFSSARTAKLKNRCQRAKSRVLGASEAPMSTWRALVSSVEKATAASGTGYDQISTAANCAPPAKTSPPIRATSSADRPFAAESAPNRRPIGIAATMAGAMSHRPSRASREREAEWKG